MTHKVVTVDSHHAYATTKVPFDSSVKEVKELLIKYGADRIREIYDTYEKIPYLTVAFSLKGRAYIIEFPIVYLARGDKRVTKPGSDMKYREELRMQISGRIIVQHLKALLIAVDLGLVTAEGALVPYLAVADQEGHPIALQDRATDPDWRNRLALPLPER